MGSKAISTGGATQQKVSGFIKFAAVVQFMVGIPLLYVPLPFFPSFDAAALNLFAVGLGYGLTGLFLIILSINVWRGNKSALTTSVTVVAALLLSIFFLRREFLQVVVLDIMVFSGPLVFFLGTAILLSLTYLILVGIGRLKKPLGPTNRKQLLKWCSPFMAILVFVVLLQSYANDKRQQWFDSKIQQVKPSKLRPMRFGANTAVFLGYSLQNTDKNDFGEYDYAQKLVRVFNEAGADIIRVGAAYDIFLNTPRELQLSDNYIQKIRQEGKKLFLADTQHSEYLTKHKVNWEQFRKLHLKRIKFFTERYRPDYYSVVTEVATYHSFEIKDEMNVEKWVKQTKEAVDLVKRISPETKTIAYIGLDDAPRDKNIEYLTRILNIENLDIVGVGFYFMPSFEFGQEFFKGFRPHDFGKELWLAETWYGLPFPSSSPWKKQLDAEWIRLTYYFANKYNFDAYLPYSFGYFVSYRSPYLGERVDFTARTPAFSIYKEIIAQSKSI